MVATLLHIHATLAAPRGVARASFCSTTGPGGVALLLKES